MRLAVPVCALVLSIASFAFGNFGCSSGEKRSGFQSSASSSTSSSSGGDADPDTNGDLGGDGTGPDPGEANTSGCADEAKLVYVVSDSQDLLSFVPNTGTFKKIGKLACKAAGTPNSMSLDRKGTAWVNYSDGKLYKVSVKDASCESTDFEPDSRFKQFGMAFSSNSATGDAETLFINGYGAGGFLGTQEKGYGLSTIDLTTFALTDIGDFKSNSLSGKTAEFTGTGDAKLYGFFTTTPATLAEIEKTTGKTSNAKKLDGVSTGAAFAFSYWGGDFWFYTAQITDSTSTVTRLAASGDGSLAPVTTNIEDIAPGHIVGAGVSTCAPLQPPK